MNTQLRDDIRILESELAALQRGCEEKAKEATRRRPEINNHLKELAAQQREEHNRIVEERIPNLREFIHRQVNEEEVPVVAEAEEARWRMFGSKDYWPLLQSDAERKMTQSSPPVSPRSRTNNPTLNGLYDREYRRLLAQIHPTLSANALDKIYGEEMARLRGMRFTEKIGSESGSPQAIKAGQSPSSPGHNSSLDHIYAAEYSRLMDQRNAERLSPKADDLSPNSRQVAIAASRPNNELEAIYGAEFARLLAQRNQERFSDGSPRSPSAAQGSPSGANARNTALDAIYEAEFRRLANQRFGEKFGDDSGSPGKSPGARQDQARGGNDELQRVYEAEIARQLQQRAAKAPQLHLQGSPYGTGSPHGMSQEQERFSLEFERALLEHHLRWQRNIAHALSVAASA